MPECVLRGRGRTWLRPARRFVRSIARALRVVLVGVVTALGTPPERPPIRFDDPPCEIESKGRRGSRKG